jgi:hypothetical protein
MGIPYLSVPAYIITHMLNGEKPEMGVTLIKGFIGAF